MAWIGLLSDSHGRAPITATAAALLVEQGAEVLVYLGDVGGEQVLDALVVLTPQEKQVPVHLVFGNNDLDWQGQSRYAVALGLQVEHPAGALRLPEGTLAFLHGDDARGMEALLATKPRWLCHGHTHRPADQRLGATRIICPGALYRAKTYTVALLDTQADRVHFFSVGE